VEWNHLESGLQSSIETAWRHNVPPLATALYNRWWQLETWLRSLVYVELKAAFGPAWFKQMLSISGERVIAETDIRYMATADSSSRLAYTDFGPLTEVISTKWDLFRPSLMAKEVGWVVSTS
jgi:hypothetical protein